METKEREHDLLIPPGRDQIAEAPLLPPNHSPGRYLTTSIINRQCTMSVTETTITVDPTLLWPSRLTNQNRWLPIRKDQDWPRKEAAMPQTTKTYTTSTDFSEQRRKKKVLVPDKRC